MNREKTGIKRTTAGILVFLMLLFMAGGAGRMMQEFAEHWINTDTITGGNR
ncbi:MAG: hypothetical protein PQJ58_06220 [Spirochaetales bacterium]|nr:hypothetical protein [Spirochaetales bacterium]